MLANIIMGLILSGTLLQPQNEQVWTLYNIQYYGAKYGVNLDDAYQMARCESKLNNIRSDFWQTEDSFGPFQLQSKFWIDNANDRGMYANPEVRKSIEANVEMTMWYVSKYGWSAWYNCAKERNLLEKRYNQELILKRNSS